MILHHLDRASPHDGLRAAWTASSRPRDHLITRLLDQELSGLDATGAGESDVGPTARILLGITGRSALGDPLPLPASHGSLGRRSPVRLARPE